MTEEHEERSTSIALSATASPLQRVEQLAPKGWRMRLAKAAAQLIAGSEKGAVAYGEIRERLDTIEGRSIVAKGMAEAVVQQAVNDPEMMERAKARFLGTILQKQQNLEAVIIGASKGLPSDITSEPPDYQQFGEVGIAEDVPLSSLDEAGVADEPLNADWAATFSEIAENATTEELQRRMSRILSGELTSPGKYSRGILRRIADLDKSDLDAMQHISPYIVGNMVLRFQVNNEQEPGINALLPLAEVGLVAESSNMLSKSWPPAARDGVEAWVLGRFWAIRVTLKSEQVLSVPMTQLTKAGVAVVELIGSNNEEDALRRFANQLDENVYSKIEIGKKVSADHVALPLRTIKPAPPSYTIPTRAGVNPFSR